MSPAASRATPDSIIGRGPWRSTQRPRKGLMSAETRKPNENAPAVRPRDQPNSSMSGGKNNENAVRAFTLSPIVTKATPTITQPKKKGRRALRTLRHHVFVRFTSCRALDVQGDE